MCSTILWLWGKVDVLYDSLVVAKVDVLDDFLVVARSLAQMVSPMAFLFHGLLC